MWVNKIKRQITLSYKGHYLIITPNKIDTIEKVPQEIKDEVKELTKNLSFLYSNFPIPRFGKITEEQRKEAKRLIMNLEN